jgi:glycerate dehydrogenase
MTGMRVVVLDSFTADQGDVNASWAELAALGQVTFHPRTPKPLVPGRCQGADAVVTNKVVLGAEIINCLPALRYIGVCATGSNVVDLEAARAKKVAVTNVPGYAADSVAQTAFAHVLHLALDVVGHSQAVKAGRWTSVEDFCFFLRPLPELSGKTLVIIGYGAIGKSVARIGKGFGMNVVLAAVPESTTAGRTPLSEALRGADVVSLHCPLTPETTNLVDERFLRTLKPGAILINTSRGGLINEADLVRALDEGRLGGVGLDVLGQEPPPGDHPLTNPRAAWASRVLVTPHLAWGTVEARARLRKVVAENLRAYQSGERLNRVD